MENSEKGTTALQLKDLSDAAFLDWLYHPVNSSKPDLYRTHLPPDITFVTIGTALNCLDYALGGKGCHWLELDLLTKSDGKKGELVIYSNNAGNWRHAGIYLGKGIVESQWGVKDAAVFRHRIAQIPSGFGLPDNVTFYKQPNLLPKHPFWQR